MGSEIYSDEDLINQYRAGNNNALSVLFSRYEPFLHSFLFSFTWIRDKSQVEDILQEVFKTLIICVRDGRFRPQGPGSFRSWLFSTARHLCYKTTEEIDAHRVIDAGKLIEALPAALEPAGLDQDEKTASLHERSDAVSGFFQSLSAENRQLLVAAMDGTPYQKIAEMPEFRQYQQSTLRRRVCDLRKRLNKELLKWQSKENK